MLTRSRFAARFRRQIPRALHSPQRDPDSHRRTSRPSRTLPCSSSRRRSMPEPFMHPNSERFCPDAVLAPYLHHAIAELRFLQQSCDVAFAAPQFARRDHPVRRSLHFPLVSPVEVWTRMGGLTNVPARHPPRPRPSFAGALQHCSENKSL